MRSSEAKAGIFKGCIPKVPPPPLVGWLVSKKSLRDSDIASFFGAFLLGTHCLWDPSLLSHLSQKVKRPKEVVNDGDLSAEIQAEVTPPPLSHSGTLQFHVGRGLSRI